MHFFAPDKNFWGGHGIVAGQTPLGLGIAYALKYQGLKGCCLTFLGDGAVNQGVYHESLNLASLWDIPVIYIIENNQYSMGTSQARSSAIKGCLAERAEGYNIDWDTVNGEDLYEVRAKTWEAMQRAHEKCRPTLLEIDTYRYYGHSVADANAKKYRSPEEIEFYKQNHDPITLWEKRLREEGILDDAGLKTIDDAAKRKPPPPCNSPKTARSPSWKTSTATSTTKSTWAPRPAKPAATSSTTKLLSVFI